MKFALSEDQQDLRSAVARLLGTRASLAQTRSEEPGAFSARDFWTELVDMGVVAVDVPERRGGTGMSAVELAVVMEQAGAVLYPGPLLATTGMAAGLLDGDDDRSADLSAALVDGTVIAAAVPDVPMDWSDPAIATQAVQDGSGWAITGRKRGVLQPDVADVFLVAARTPAGVGLFSVRPSDVTVHVESGLESGRQLGTVELDGASAELVVEDAAERIMRAGLRASTALAAECIGAARSAMELTRDHVSTRQQFGQPVGAFQAVKHRLADLLVEIELATSATYLAACHVAAGDVAAARASVPLALDAATAALARAGSDAVQLHGGIGFTWESACHWYVSWAQVNRVLLGAHASHLEHAYDNAPLAAV